MEWKREGVMDGDSGDEGNDELTCVRDQIRVISRQAQFLGKVNPGTG